MLQNASPLRKSAPGPPNISDEHVSCNAPAEMHFFRSSWNAPRLPSFLEMPQNPDILLNFDKVHNPLRLPRETTFARPKVVRTFGVLTCWLRNVLRATTAFTVRHLNFQKWSDNEVFCTFWLGNVLRAATACTFSTSQLLKVIRTWCVLHILTWKCASRHNGVHFFDIAAFKGDPNPWCV